MEFLKSIPVWAWVVIGVAVVAIVAPLKLKVFKAITANAKKRESQIIDE